MNNHNFVHLFTVHLSAQPHCSPEVREKTSLAKWSCEKGGRNTTLSGRTMIRSSSALMLVRTKTTLLETRKLTGSLMTTTGLDYWTSRCISVRKRRKILNR